MIKVPDTVADILFNDEVASESFRAGLLNLSAYAEQIKPKVEKLTFKEVKKNTIVVALSRLAKSTKTAPVLKPDVKLANLSVKSPLVALTYDKTVDIQRRIATLNPFLIAATDLFSIKEGPSEITLFCTEKSLEFIKKHMNILPKSETKDLVAVSVGYAMDYSDTPNILYALLSSLAVKRINLVDIVTTHSEICFLVVREDMELLVKTLNAHC